MLKNLDLSEDAEWKLRFRAPSILWAQIANLNAQRGLVCTNRDGTLQLYAWQVDTGELRQLTHQKTGVYSGLLSADGEHAYYLRDDKGSETGHFVRIPFRGGPHTDITPDLPPYGAFQISQSFNGNILGTRISNPDGQMLYAFAPDKAPRRVYKSRDYFLGPSLSYDGKLAVIASTRDTHSSDMRLMAFDVSSGKLIAELWDGEGASHTLGDFSPLPGDSRILSTTSRSGYARPMIWDPVTGERHDLEIDRIQGEVNAWSWSKDASKVLLSQVNQAGQQLYLYHTQTNAAKKLDHPDGVLGSYFDKGMLTDDRKIVITWQDPTHPPGLVALDSSTGKKQCDVLTAGKAPAGRPWESVSFKSQENVAVHGWLAVPKGEGPFPAVIHVHGGPTTVMTDTYSPESQAWLDHGFAFFSINYHGSTTFGKAFEKSILHQLGKLEIEDIAAGHQWLVKEKIARPGEIFLTGESYGGFLTLLAMGKLPGLWAGGMAGVAIADWALMYADESENLRGYHRVLFGGPPEETPEAHKISSPITYAEQVQAPVMVIQGRNDSRCPARQMEIYESRMKSLGKQIDVHWFNAGHGSLDQELQLHHQERRMRFACKILEKNSSLHHSEKGSSFEN